MDKFKDVKFMSAKEKEKVVEDFRRFLKSNFDRKYFTKRLYEHLHLHCSFIAHYDIDGFYATYFHEPEMTIEFLNQFLTGKSTELKGTWWLTGDYADVNEAMCKVAREMAKRGLIGCLRDKQNRMDVARARALIEKQGNNKDKMAMQIIEASVREAYDETGESAMLFASGLVEKLKEAGCLL